MAKISKFGMHTAYLLGFERIADVRGITSLLSLFENAMILSGIYLQIRPNRHAYIGKTSNLIRRFERHLQNGIVIEELAFMPLQLKSLDKKEKEIIAKAERYGIELDNLLLVESTWLSKQRWEDYFSDQELQDWIKTDHQEQTKALTQTMATMSAGLRHQYQLAQAHPLFDSTLELGRNFINRFIPKAALTAGNLWSADANYVDQTERFLPLIRLHVGNQTLMTLGFYKRIPTEPWMQLLVSKDALKQEKLDITTLLNAFPFLLLEEKDAQFWQVSAHAQMMKPVLDWMSRPIKQTIIKSMKESLRFKGNSALHYALTL